MSSKKPEEVKLQVFVSKPDSPEGVEEEISLTEGKLGDGIQRYERGRPVELTPPPVPPRQFPPKPKVAQRNLPQPQQYQRLQLLKPPQQFPQLERAQQPQLLKPPQQFQQVQQPQKAQQVQQPQKTQQVQQPQKAQQVQQPQKPKQLQQPQKLQLLKPPEPLQQLHEFQKPPPQLSEPQKMLPHQIPVQVIHIKPGRVVKQKIPPAVPVRKRKPTSTAEDGTQMSTANASAQISTENTSANTPTQKSTENTKDNTLVQVSTTEEQNSEDFKNPFIQEPQKSSKGSRKPFVETGFKMTVFRSNSMLIERHPSPEETPKEQELTAKETLATLTPKGKVIVTAPSFPQLPTETTLSDPRSQRRSSSPFSGTQSGVKTFLQTRSISLAEYPKYSSLQASKKDLERKSMESLEENESEEAKDERRRRHVVFEPTIILSQNSSEPDQQSTLDTETKKSTKTNGSTFERTVANIRKRFWQRASAEIEYDIESGDQPSGSGISGRRGSTGSIGSDSSSPAMRTPLLPGRARASRRQDPTDEITVDDSAIMPEPRSMKKSVSTPANLQTSVKFSDSTMTIHHKIIQDIRAGANEIRRTRLRCRIVQILLNMLAVFAVGGGLILYFTYGETPQIEYVNNTVTNTIAVSPPDTNPSPGFCFKLTLNFCIHKVPYNYTTFPNHVVNMNQEQAEQELDLYDAIVDVRCYELSALFLCSIFVPKCGIDGELLYPCKSLCEEMKRRCGFFIDVFGLPPLPEYLMDCRLLPDSENPDVCVGYTEVKEAKKRASRPKCSDDAFLCDNNRCIPIDWKCDGHLDCEDETDETACFTGCPPDKFHCGHGRCINKTLLCDGIIDCPYGQDERKCLRLQDKMGDVGRGLLEAFDPKTDEWVPACVSNWDNKYSAQAICSLLGYSVANYTRLIIKDTDVEVAAPKTVNITDYKKHSNWMKDFTSCGLHHYPIVNMECRNFECGRRKIPVSSPKGQTKRIVGGYPSTPGSWPFLAAIHGGPEEIFYCAGVLIADQWVLTAAHCVGNASDDAISGWKIQLGITRRKAHNFYGTKASVKRVIPHPDYNMGVNHDNDIALFQLKRPVDFSENVLPVCLPPPGLELPPGLNCTVIGWGKSVDSESSEYEPSIHEVEVPIINRRVCNSWMIYRDLNVTDGMICAGLTEGGKDACQGDSGGPLLCSYDRLKRKYFVGGIVSWGIKCAHPQLPGVYAYVPKYVNWIKEQMRTYNE